MRKLMKTLLSAVAFFICMLAATSCVTDDDKVTSLEAGDAVPVFSVTMNDGSVVTSESLRGYRTLIVFFNTACADCRRELPVIQKVYEKAPADARIVCIAREENEISIAAFWESAGLTMPYSAQPDRKVYSLFASSIIPRIYAVDENLIIMDAFSDKGMPTEDILLSFLDGEDSDSKRQS